MSTTKDDIKRWLNTAKEEGNNYLLVACDTFDYDDYPLYFKFFDNLKYKFNHPSSMEKFMECYDLSLNWESQLNEPRSWHPSKQELEN